MEEQNKEQIEQQTTEATTQQINCIICNSYKLMLVQVISNSTDTKLLLLCNDCGFLQEVILSGSPNLTATPTGSKHESSYLG